MIVDIECDKMLKCIKSYCNKISVQSVKDSAIKDIISALHVCPQVAKKRKKIWRKQKHYGEKEWKFIKTKKNFLSDRRKGSPTNLQVFYRYY